MQVDGTESRTTFAATAQTWGRRNINTDRRGIVTLDFKPKTLGCWTVLTVLAPLKREASDCSTSEREKEREREGGREGRREGGGGRKRGREGGGKRD